ncbi:ATP-dependent Clp protease, ATP-binding subunit ClpX [Thiorhodococcus drewsii AZ1]|uniref:ATP-dependent Clp protease, ATP-binding subunit ClpX n=1 Tax=Thiorhodococcus drewsii AZ1 TaxID=765913 RepID=G2E7M0_9GAMM|nr:ATP-dependent Clp protease ATP-binding subunit ClpX [Thiorhodococcus drewsii]EGV27904.1 ATP-dependent Clp protease, ATP-binding subunit ClpX [Thiorhodococcus drewsii AZ1]
MNDTVHTCSFCGAPQAPDTPLIAGIDGHICEACVTLAHQVVSSWGRARALSGPLKSPPKPLQIKEQLDRYVIGQEAAKESLAVAVYNHYKRLAAESKNPRRSLDDDDRVEIDKSNILLLGPSGTGKTLLASTLARIVGVPFVIADATTLTQAGYVGEDVESILGRLLDASNGSREIAEWGMVYIDEVDKLARQGETAHGTRDVSGEGVQQALLKLVEGTQVKINPKGRKDSGDGALIDTRNILFLVGGAFAGLEKVLTQRLRPSPTGIGFQADVGTSDEDTKTRDPELYRETHPDDLRQFGLIPEFIGRFPVLVGLHDLDEAALVRILTEPKNALIRQYQQLFAFEGVQLEFTPEAMTAIARKAIDRGTGARGLRSVLEGLLQRPMFELPSMTNVVGCQVDVETIEGTGPVHWIHGSEDEAERASAGG